MTARPKQPATKETKARREKKPATVSPARLAAFNILRRVED